MDDWQEEDRDRAYRSAEICATIMNQPVYGFTRERIVTAAELLGETGAGSSVGSPEAFAAQIRLMADHQKKTKAQAHV